MVVLLEFIPYDLDIEQHGLGLRGLTTVVGITNKYFIPKLHKVRYAVFEESDCLMSDSVAVELGRQASVNAFSKDLISLVVRTKQGFHYYLDLWGDSLMDSVLKASRFRSYLPAVCRDLRHELYSLKVLNLLKRERYVLRVSPTKYGRDYLKVIYYKPSRDRYHNEFIGRVRSLMLWK